MDARQLRMYQAAIEYSDGQLAIALRCDPATVRRYSSGELPIPVEVAAILEEIARLHFADVSVSYPWQDTGRPKALVSACIYGYNLRWHGKEQPGDIRRKIREAAGMYDLIPVCPEVMAGFGVPRPPVRSINRRLFQTDPETRSEIGREVTKEYHHGVRYCLWIAAKHDVKIAFLVTNSPTAGEKAILGRLCAEHGIKYERCW